jgi:hypothetical protein
MKERACREGSFLTDSGETCRPVDVRFALKRPATFDLPENFFLV